MITRFRQIHKHFRQCQTFKHRELNWGILKGNKHKMALDLIMSMNLEYILQFLLKQFLCLHGSSPFLRYETVVGILEIFINM